MLETRKRPKMREATLIYIVEGDQKIRESTSLMLEGHGYRCAVYSTAAEFLATNPRPFNGCLLVDIRARGLDGLTLQSELAKRGLSIPVIFMTGFNDIVHAIRALKAGAIDFIEKPCPPHAFLRAIDRALTSGKDHQPGADELRAVHRRMARLSPREQDVMKSLVAGEPNRVIARKLGMSPRAVEIHRARIMDKMEATSLSDLVRIAMAVSESG
jgi:two-component system response regulator FixJ